MINNFVSIHGDEILYSCETCEYRQQIIVIFVQIIEVKTIHNVVYNKLWEIAVHSVYRECLS